MTAIVNITEMRMRCPRCGARPTIQSATPFRPGFEYLTLRCTACVNVFDAQVGEEVLLAHELQQPARPIPTYIFMTSSKPKPPAKTKAELREMLAEAVRNAQPQTEPEPLPKTKKGG